MRNFAIALCILGFGLAPAMANHHYRPPAPPVAPVHPPTQHRPPVVPNQQILQQRQLQRGATQQMRAGETVNLGAFKAIDDKVGDWADFATLSEAELATLFKEMGVGDANFDRNQIKTMMLGEMAGSGAPPEALQQLSASLDAMIGLIQTSMASSIANYPTDMAREFKQIYAANCCGKAQFMAALGAAETKLANAFRSGFASSMAGMAAQNGAPPEQMAAMRGALVGGTTTVIFDAGDPSVIAASNMVANGRGGPTVVATNNNPGSNNAPPLNPGGTNTGNSNSNQTLPNPGTQNPVTQNPVTQNPVTQNPVTQNPVTQNPVTQNPVTQNPVTQNPVTQNPVTQNPITQNPVTQNPGPGQIITTFNLPPANPSSTNGGGQTLPTVLPKVDPVVLVEPNPGGGNSPSPATDSNPNPGGLLDLTIDPFTPDPSLTDGNGGLPDVMDTTGVDKTPVVVLGSGGEQGKTPDELRDEIVKLIGEIKRDPGRKPELMGELRDLNAEREKLVGQNNSSGLTGFYASDESKPILTAVPYVIDGAKIVVITVACVGTGGAACAGVAAVDTIVGYIDPVAGVVGNTIANYDNSGELGTSTVSAIGSQLYEEGSKAVGGKTFIQVIGSATVEGLGAKGEVLVKVAELGGKAIGEFGPGLVSNLGSSSSSYDASASLGSSGSGGSFYSGGSSGSGTLIQR
jgi:hypothetical protein